MTSHSASYIITDKLLRIYKLMKSHPNKVYTRYGLGLSYRNKHYMTVLIRFGLVEKVSIKYPNGSYYPWGYKFRRKE